MLCNIKNSIVKTNKKYRIFAYQDNNRFYELKEDFHEVGWYLFVYDKNMKCISDHLQEDFETITNFAFEEYGIPGDKWVER